MKDSLEGSDYSSTEAELDSIFGSKEELAAKEAERMTQVELAEKLARENYEARMKARTARVVNDEDIPF